MPAAAVPLPLTRSIGPTDRFGGIVSRSAARPADAIPLGSWMQTNHELLTDARAFLRDQVVGERADDEAAESWDAFFTIYDEIIRRFARACGVGDDSLDECVQEVWVAIVGHLEGFEIDPSRGRFRTWLYQVVRSKATDLLRDENRMRRFDDLASSLSLACPDTEPVDGRLERLWRRESLRTLLRDFRERVSAENFAIFRARALRGESYERIGADCGLSPATARVRYHRVLERFRELCTRYAVSDLL